MWGCNYAECLKPLFLLQKKMIRIITSSPFRACTNHLLVSNKLLDLKDINSYMTGVFMYNTMHAPEPTMFTSFYRINNTYHDHNTRGCNDIHVVHAKSNVRNFSMRVNGGILWNSIPKDIRNSPSLSVFKRKLKLYLIDIKSNIGVLVHWYICYGKQHELCYILILRTVKSWKDM